VIPKNPLLDALAATSVGIVGGVSLLDLCYEEDARAQVDMNVVMTSAGKFVELQATAEKTAFDDAQMIELIGLARRGIMELLVAQQEALEILS
jgi:ribonuclease PH